MQEIIDRITKQIIHHKKYCHFDIVRRLQQRLDKVIDIKNKKR